MTHLDDRTRQNASTAPEGSRRRSPLWFGVTERLIAAALLSATLWVAVAWATA